MKFNKMKKIILTILFSLFVMVGCSSNETKQENHNDNSKATYQKISADKAYQMMQDNMQYIILDVRSEEEYQELHIKDARLIPVDKIGVGNEVALNIPNSDTLVFVYCRSGNRSATATKKLVEMGYTNVYDIGAISDWNYETVSE